MSNRKEFLTVVLALSFAKVVFAGPAMAPRLPQARPSTSSASSVVTAFQNAARTGNIAEISRLAPNATSGLTPSYIQNNIAAITSALQSSNGNVASSIGTISQMSATGAEFTQSNFTAHLSRYGSAEANTQTVVASNVSTAVSTSQIQAALNQIKTWSPESAASVDAIASDNSVAGQSAAQNLTHVVEGVQAGCSIVDRSACQAGVATVVALAAAPTVAATLNGPVVKTIFNTEMAAGSQVSPAAVIHGGANVLQGAVQGKAIPAAIQEQCNLLSPAA